YKDIIYRKHDLMNIGIKDMSKFYEALKSLCDMYTELDKDYQDYQDCANCSQKSNEFVVSFEKLTSYDYGDYLKNDKLAEYAILWLSYKLNKYPQKGINILNDFYTKHIEKNEYYNVKITKSSDKKTYKDIIYRKHDLMNIGIKDMSKFYEALKSLCDMYTELDKDYQDYQDCANCSQKSNEFVVSFEKLNEDPNITGNSSYRKILHTLSTDYDDFKNYFAEKCSGYSNIPALSEIKTPLILLIARKLIPVLLAFAIPIFLGIAYKVNNKEFIN
ncbi:Plasmodium variant antigen protein Cir/Yir/Bir, putative, partial [Plasmodium chabaudi adami]